MKKCCGCKKEKDPSEFYKNKSSKDGHRHYCIVCSKQLAKKHYNPKVAKDSNLRNQYNLTPEALEELFISQDKKCKICGIEKLEVSMHGGLYIDHCHTTGKVRGLLCRECNLILGLANDRKEIFEKSIEYLSSNI